MKKWEVKKLEEICEFGNGLWTGKKPPFINVGVIRNTNFTKDCELDDSNIAYLDVEKSQFEKRKLLYGDIVLEKSGGGPKQPVGRVVVFDKENGNFSFSNFTSVIRIKDKNQIDFRYLHKYLFFIYGSGITEKMQSRSTGIRNLKFDEYKKIEIPLPPLPTQQRIVALLDETIAALNTVQANAERNQVNAREVFESTLQTSVAGKESKKWDLKKVGEIAEHSLGKMLDKAKNRGAYKKYLRNLNVRWFDFDLSDVAEMRFTDDESEKYTAIKGDLMICEGGYPGRAAIWEADHPIYFQKAIHRVRFEKQVIAKWFLYFLYASSLNGNLKQYTAGAGIQHFTGQALDRFEFPVPPLTEQRAIVKRLENISAETKRLEEIYAQKSAAVEELKKSVLQQAFEGEL